MILGFSSRLCRLGGPSDTLTLGMTQFYLSIQVKYDHGFTWRLCNSDCLVGSAALVGECTLLTAVLVK